MRVPLLIACLSLTAAAGADAPSGESPRAHTNYLLHCAGCHRVDGGGLPGAVPDLRRYVGLFAGSPDGRSFLARAPNASSAPISDAELAEVLNWIVFTMGDEQTAAAFQPYTAEEAGRFRRMPLAGADAARGELLRRLNPEPGYRDDAQ